MASGRVESLLAERKELRKDVRKLKRDNREHQYGGAVFHANCSTCNRKLQMPEQLSVNKFMAHSTWNSKSHPFVIATCTRCGKVKAGFKRMIPVKSGG
ncbi:hypothetical protein KAR91_20845 [Candidatus Pacearchaeota archaeon]|nr:hypothetical protein [Candidatus Pacearchaeota archaeon]